MNILFISALLPYPLHSGGQVRMYHLLKKLSKKHHITLASFVRSNEEREFIDNLTFLHRIKLIFRGKRLQPTYIVKYLTGQSLLLASYTNSAMHHCIESLLQSENYDLIHIEPFYVYPSLPPLNIPLVTCEHNMEYEVYEHFSHTFPFAPLRPLIRIEATRIKTSEITVLKTSDHIISVSKEDKQKIQSHARNVPVTVVPNGVDTHYFTFVPRTTDPRSPTFLFTGNISWMPNREAMRMLVDIVWPKVKIAIPRAKLRIVGRGIENGFDKKLDISYEGDVEDIRTVYESCDALLAPMGISGGSKFKILEAMASGLPVVTTREGAAGLEVKNGKDVLIVEHNNSFAGVIVSMLNDTSRLKNMVHSARTLVENIYDWEPISRQLDTVWESVV